MEIDREETARRLGRAFEGAAQKLADGGVPDAEIGKAMVAIGLLGSNRRGFNPATRQVDSRNRKKTPG